MTVTTVNEDKPNTEHVRSLAEFLEDYEHEHWYLDDHVPVEMMHELPVRLPGHFHASRVRREIILEQWHFNVATAIGFPFHVPRSICHVSRVAFQLSRFTCRVSSVTFHVSRSICHVSSVTFHVSRSICHVSRVKFHLSRFT